MDMLLTDRHASCQEARMCAMAYAGSIQPLPSPGSLIPVAPDSCSEKLSACPVRSSSSVRSFYRFFKASIEHQELKAHAHAQVRARAGKANTCAHGALMCFSRSPGQAVG